MVDVLPDNFTAAGDNVPLSSFPSPVPAPVEDPWAGDLLYVGYNPAWQAVLLAAATQLINPATYDGTNAEKTVAVERADTLMTLLVTPAEIGTGQSPFWDDPDGEDADGSATDNTYTYTEQIEDWVIAAFIAASGVPGAALTYLTIAPRFRLAFNTRDYGGIAQIFIDDVLFSTVDTYSATPGQVIRDIIIP